MALRNPKNTPETRQTTPETPGKYPENTLETPGKYPETPRKHPGKYLKKHHEMFHVEHQFKVYANLCRSVWCPRCSKFSPTNKRIREKIALLDWRKVRHIILTLSRGVPPHMAMQQIRYRRSIPKFLAELELKKWIWILEFHADGYPHWHILVESPHGGMIGKRKIQRAWGMGNCWESYIKDIKHWKAISGYHCKHGYLAGADSKKHQLELPKYLEGETKVRKYAYSASLRTPSPVSEPSQEDESSINNHRKPKKPCRPYFIRFVECDKTVSIEIDDNKWCVIPGRLTEVLDVCTELFEKIDYHTFNIQNDHLWDWFIEMLELKIDAPDAL
jgi:hypothetical protein